MIRRPPRSTQSRSSAASDVYKRQPYVSSSVFAMRLGVLDIGSNTGHLLVVDAHDGAAPIPAYSHKEALRLAEHLDEHGAVSRQGVDALVLFVKEALEAAQHKGCEEILGFATSAVRDAVNTCLLYTSPSPRDG